MTFYEALLAAGLPVSSATMDDGGMFSVAWSANPTTAQLKQVDEIAASMPAKTAEVFALPVSAPEFIVHSPKPKDDPLEALAHAAALMAQTDKPTAEILFNILVYVQDVEKRLKNKNI